MPCCLRAKLIIACALAFTLVLADADWETGVESETVYEANTQWLWPKSYHNLPCLS